MVSRGLRRCGSICPFGDAKGLIRCTSAREHTLPHRNDARGKVWFDPPRRGTHYRSRGRLVKIAP